MLLKGSGTQREQPQENMGEKKDKTEDEIEWKKEKKMKDIIIFIIYRDTTTSK